MFTAVTRESEAIICKLCLNPRYTFRYHFHTFIPSVIHHHFSGGTPHCDLSPMAAPAGYGKKTKGSNVEVVGSVPAMPNLALPTAKVNQRKTLVHVT